MIETQRLILRDYVKSDWERVHLYASIPEFSQYDFWGPNTEADTKNFIADAINKSKKVPRYEYEFAIILKSTNLLIGGCGIRREWESSAVANLGYAVNPEFQSMGFATEVSKKLISFGFDELNLKVIYATCDTNNIASYKVMEKVGMRKVGHIKDHKEFKGKMRDSSRYEITV